MRTTLRPAISAGRALGFVVVVTAAVLVQLPAMAQQPTNFGSASGITCPGGNVICNGSINFLTTEMFFEPETPAQTLKGAPTTFNELEQLLDNPYVYTWGAACNDKAGLVPGNYQGYPTYCTTNPAAPHNPGMFIRRPNAVDASGNLTVSTLPPLLVHPPNYNPQTGFGVEMRILNPSYMGTNFQVSGTVNDRFSVTRGNPTGAVRTGICYTLDPNGCVPATEVFPITSGASRGLTTGTATAPGTTEIDMNVILGRDLHFCQTNPEPVPIFGAYSTTGLSQSTGFDSENLTTCGGDPGEPGAASRAHNNTTLALCATEVLGAGSQAGYLCEDNIGLPYVGQGTLSSYSIPAVPAPNPVTAMLMQIPNRGITVATETGVMPNGTGVVLNPALGFRLTDPARGGVINALNIATGVGGLHKPSLRKAEVGGTGARPNYLWNSLGAVTGARPDPTGADLQPANENDFVGLYSPTGTAPATNADFLTQKQAARYEAMALGKALFWDQQVGSDGVQACGSCHAHAAADNRTKNQLNPNGQDGLRGAPTNFGGTPGNVFDPFPPNYDLQRADFPLMKLTDPEIAGDPLCTPKIQANVDGISFPDGDPPDHPKPTIFTVCDATNKISDTEEVASSMGVHFGLFGDIAAGTGATLACTAGVTTGTTACPFGPPSAAGGVRALIHDQRSSTTLVQGSPGLTTTVTPVQAALDNLDPIPGFQGVGIPQPDGTTIAQFRRVEPRNTPTIFLADMNFDNFWDGRARHDDNGGSVFGPSDPQSHVWVDQGTGVTATRQLIRFSSLGSLAKGPALSKFEMSFDGRNWAKIGKKLLQAGVTPLANQLVDPTDGVLGRYSNQGGSACAALPAADRSPAGGPPTTMGSGVPGLCISYPALIRHAFYPALHSNTAQHLSGCYTDGRADIHPNQCSAVGVNVAIPTLQNGAVVNSAADPFDNYVLYGTALTGDPSPFVHAAAGAAAATDTNQFSQMEANFSLFWGQSIHVWATILVPDDTPDDKFLDANPDTGAANGEVGEPLLVLDIPNCPNPTGYHRGYFIGSDGFVQYRGSCFTEVGNFKRDVFNPNDLVHFQNDATVAGHPRMTACINELLDAGGIRQCTQRVAAGGTRQPTDPDPLLGFDIFFGANMSLKNPNYRSARCGACHNSPALTDNTGPFTVKAQELDNFPEFQRENPVIEPLTEPMVRERMITGFLLESEVNEPGQDAIERRAGNLSLVPAPATAAGYIFGGAVNPNCDTAACAGYVHPDAITAKKGPDGTYSDASGTGDPANPAYIIHSDFGSGPVSGPGNPTPFTGFGGTFLDNGVYNIGVRPCVADETHVTGACEDTGRGNTDPFGWPLSLAALMLKNWGGPGQQPGVPIAQFDQHNNNAAGRADALSCSPYCSTGGLNEMSKQDQRINPGYTDEVSHPLAPPYLAPFLNKVPVGDEHPQADEGCGPAGGGCPNTLMDVANEEGFPEIPFNSRSSTVEVLNAAQAPGDSSFVPGVLVNGNCPPPAVPGSTVAGVLCSNSPSVLNTTATGELGSNQMGTWPVVNKVNRFGSFKAPQLREVELTGPYFHNGGKLTLRQVVDFYVRGGDFPVTNSNHRDFNILNLNAELQSDLSEEDKVALVDYMLEFTDDRVAFEKSPFDHPQLILPLDGTAPENDGTLNFHDAATAGTCTVSPLGPGQQACTSTYPMPVGATGPLFLNVPATGVAGNPNGRLPNFMGIAGAAADALNPGRIRLVGADANVGSAACPASGATSQYCH